MIGKMITFGLGVVTGVWIGPTVRGLQARLAPVEEAPAALPPAIEAPMDEDEPLIFPIGEPEDTSEFDAAVEAFLHASSEAAEHLLA